MSYIKQQLNEPFDSAAMFGSLREHFATGPAANDAPLAAQDLLRRAKDETQIRFRAVWIRWNDEDLYLYDPATKEALAQAPWAPHQYFPASLPITRGMFAKRLGLW